MATSDPGLSSPRLLDPTFLPRELWIQIWKSLLPAQAIIVTDETHDDTWHYIILKDAPAGAPPVKVRADLPYPEGATYQSKEYTRIYRATSTQKESEIERLGECIRRREVRRRGTDGRF